MSNKIYQRQMEKLPFKGSVSLVGVTRAVNGYMMTIAPRQGETQQLIITSWSEVTMLLHHFLHAANPAQLPEIHVGEIGEKES